MSKITFRADDDLVERLEEFDASKSEVMREALRTYLDGAERDLSGAETVDDALGERIDQLIAERLDAALGDRVGRHRPQDVNVNITLDGATADISESDPERETDSETRKTQAGDAGDTRENAGGVAKTERKTCPQCGEDSATDHVYCPNCGEKSSHRVFCDCGDELRSDWAFCPGCGRRTPAADVLDQP